MAELRLIAVVLVAGCSRGEAAPTRATSGLKAPAGWRDAAAVASAAEAAAKSDGVQVTGAEAWVEPARGCFAVWLSLGGSAASIDAAAGELVAALGGVGVTVRDVKQPTSGERGTLALGFDRPPVHGQLRADLTSAGAVTALACGWNEREPAACQPACTALLGSLR